MIPGINNTMDRYIGRTVLASVAIVGLLFLILVCAFALLEELRDEEAGYGFLEAARYILYTAPRRAYELMPFVVFLGALIGMGVLANNRELVVFRSAGVSIWRLFAAVSMPVLLVVAVGIGVGEWFAPLAEAQAESEKAQARQGGGDVQIKGGYWYREGGLYMSVQAIGSSASDAVAATTSGLLTSTDSDARIVGIRQYQLGPDQELLWVRKAANGRYEGDGSWRLFDVVETRFADETSITSTIDSVLWRSQADPRLLSTRILVEPNKLSVLDLQTQIDYMQREGLDASTYSLALWSKLLLPLSVLGLALLAVTFVLGPLRQVSMGTRLTVGVLTALGFKYLQDLFAPMSQVFDLPPSVAVLLPILACWAVALIGVRRVR